MNLNPKLFCDNCNKSFCKSCMTFLNGLAYCSDCLEVKQPNESKMRIFSSKATRDTAEGKLDYIKALSPIVLRRYVQYLNKHRLQADGLMREFDNWKQGIPQDTYRSSSGRHFIDDWLLSEGYATEDNHGPVTDIEDVICAELFNLMGRLHEMLKERLEKEKKDA